MANKKQKIKEIRKMFVWIIGLVLTTSAVSAGYVYFSQAFNVLEDKTTFTEICRFELSNNRELGKVRSVTNDEGRHIFLAEDINPETGNRDGFYVYEEGLSSDPCLGVKPIAIDLFGEEFEDVSAAQGYLADWSLENAVFVPDVYSEDLDTGYISIFMKENTNAYSKDMVVVNLSYSYGKLEYKNSFKIFDQNPSFSKIVDLHYSYEDNSLYIFGVSESEGLRNRGIRRAALSHEDLLYGNTAGTKYCQLESDGLCYWQADPLKASISIDSKAGDLSFLGVQNELYLLLQASEDEVKIYDLAQAGTTWNPGLRLINCRSNNTCNNFTTYDYQASYFENTDEKVEVMTFYSLSTLGNKVIFSEGRVDDFSITKTVNASLLPFENAYAALIGDVGSSSSGTKKTVTYSAPKKSTTTVKKKSKSSAPKNTQPKNTVKAVVKNNDDDAIKALKEDKASSKSVTYVAKDAKKKETKKKNLVEKLLNITKEEEKESVEVNRKAKPDKSSDEDVITQYKEAKASEAAPAKKPTKTPTKTPEPDPVDIIHEYKVSKAADKGLTQNSIKYEKKDPVSSTCEGLEDNLGYCIKGISNDVEMSCDGADEVYDMSVNECISKTYIPLTGGGKVAIPASLLGDTVTFESTALGEYNMSRNSDLDCEGGTGYIEINTGASYCVFSLNSKDCDSANFTTNSGVPVCMYSYDPIPKVESNTDKTFSTSDSLFNQTYNLNLSSDPNNECDTAGAEKYVDPDSGREYCLLKKSISEQMGNNDCGVTVNSGGIEYCINILDNYSEEITLVAQNNEPCSYGAISEEDQVKCDAQLPNCPDNVVVSSMPTNASSPSYAAYAKCISGGKVYAACPSGTALNSQKTKCVVPGYKDESLEGSSDIDESGNVLLGVTFTFNVEYSYGYEELKYNDYLANYIYTRYDVCPSSYTECSGTGAVLQRASVQRCYRDNGIVSNGQRNISVLSCCAPGYYIRDGVCRSAENIRVDNNGREATNFDNCSVGTHAEGSCKPSVVTPLCSTVGRAHKAFKLWDDVAKRENLSPSNPDGKCIQANGDVVNYWKY